VNDESSSSRTYELKTRITSRAKVLPVLARLEEFCTRQFSDDWLFFRGLFGSLSKMTIDEDLIANDLSYLLDNKTL
jgi:hypothetical protein